MPALKFTNIGPCPDDWRGRRARDTVSKFTGYAVARYDYLNGCIRIEVSGVDKDNKPESWVFDEQQLEWAEQWLNGFEPVKPEPPEPYHVKKTAAKRPGGPPVRKPISR